MLAGIVKDLSSDSREIFIQFALNLRLHHGFERGQEHAQAGVDPDALVLGGDVSVHAIAGEVQGVAFPVRGDVELFLQAVGDVLDHLAGACGRQGVVAGDVDLAHRSMVPVRRDDDNVLTEVASQSAMFADVCIDGCPMRIEFASGTREPVIWTGGTLRIGRADGADLHLDGAGVSARHVGLTRDARGIVLDVERGAGRVYVNARPVRERALLRLGDSLSIGGHRLRLCADADASDTIDIDTPTPDDADEGADAVIALRAVAGPLSGCVWPLGTHMDLDSRGPVDVSGDEALALTAQGHGVYMDAGALGAGDVVRVNGRVVQHASLGDGDQLTVGVHRFVLDVSSAPEPPPAPIPADDEDRATETRRRGAPQREMGWLIVTAAVLALVLTWVLLAHY